LDLIALLLRKQLGYTTAAENATISGDFQLILYVTFHSREDSIALEFLEGVQELFQKAKKDTF